MRSAMIVISVCLVGSVALAFVVRGKLKTEFVASQDLMLGLIYFMEQSDGRLPVTEAEFRAADFVEELPDGGVLIHAPADTRYRPETHGYPIPDLSAFNVRWGFDLGTLSIDEYQNLRDPSGEKVALLSWPSSPPSGKGYSLILVSTAAEIREHLANLESSETAGGS